MTDPANTTSGFPACWAFDNVVKKFVFVFSSVTSSVSTAGSPWLNQLKKNHLVVETTKEDHRL